MISSSIRPHGPKGYTLVRLCGSGARSTVWEGISNTSKQKFAIKIIEESCIKTQKSKDFLKKEIELHKIMAHPNIVKLCDVVEHSNNVYLIEEFVESGTIENQIVHNGKYNENEARKLFIQILAALDYIHGQMHVVHRDLKTDNIMITKTGVIKLIDFGFAREINDLYTEGLDFCGSPRYVAPEVYAHKNYSYPMDIWSLGVVLYHMVSGSFPFDGSTPSEVSFNVLNRDIVYPPGTSVLLRSILSSMLQKNPLKRPTTTELLRHPWVLQTSIENDSTNQRSNTPLHGGSPIKDKFGTASAPNLTRGSLSTGKPDVIDRLLSSGRFKVAESKKSVIAETPTILEQEADQKPPKAEEKAIKADVKIEAKPRRTKYVKIEGAARPKNKRLQRPRSMDISKYSVSKIAENC